MHRHCPQANTVGAWLKILDHDSHYSCRDVDVSEPIGDELPADDTSIKEIESAHPLEHQSGPARGPGLRLDPVHEHLDEAEPLTDDGRTSIMDEFIDNNVNPETRVQEDDDEAALQLPMGLDAHISSMIPAENHVPESTDEEEIESDIEAEPLVLTPVVSETEGQPPTTESDLQGNPDRCYICGRILIRSEMDVFECACGRIGHAIHLLWHHWNTSFRWGPLWKCPACETTMIPPGHHLEEMALANESD